MSPEDDPVGRKPLYDWPTVLDEVCDWLASGRTIRDYSRQDGKPTFELIYRRVAKDAELGSRIARARSEGADAIAEEALAIVDLCAEKPELAAACKVRFEGRLKLLAKWNSGRYGDKQQVDLNAKLSLDDVIAQTLRPKTDGE